MKLMPCAAMALFVGVLAGFSMPASANPGWTNFGSISTLEQDPANAGSVTNQVFIVVSVTTNPSGCSVSTGFYFSMEGATQVDVDRKKRLFAMLMAAQVSARPVRLYATGTCHAVGYAELDGVVF